MNAPERIAIAHGTRSHAILSASSAERWLNCPPSARINEAYPDEHSPYAADGTRQHELAERCLLTGRDAMTINGDHSREHREAVQVYLDYVRAIPGELMVEQRLSFEQWVPEGFGTCDAIVISDRHMSVIDYKGGSGVKVYATDNPQLKLYALAAFAAYDAIYGPIQQIKLAIVQPALDHIDEWEISSNDLLAWADNFVKPIAALAIEGKGEVKAGSHCKFCKCRHTCRTRAEANLAIAKDEFGEFMPKAASLSDEELAALYPKLADLISWASDLKEYMQARAETGTHYTGLKLVEGRSSRVIADPERAAALLKAEGFAHDRLFVPEKLQTLTALEKLVGKKRFAELLGDCLSKPAGKPTLVTADDERPELNGIHSAQADFTV